MSEETISCGNFSFFKTRLQGAYVIETVKFGDNRGHFMETYKKADFYQAEIKTEFVQDNQSYSSKGVLRGLHFQRQHPQAKLVRVVTGEVFDVAVDLRPDSGTFGKWGPVTFPEDNGKQFYIPRGFAHGFLVLSDTAIFAYKCDDVYKPRDEGGIAYDDSDIGIVWPHVDSGFIINEKDLNNLSFGEYQASL